MALCGNRLWLEETRLHDDISAVRRNTFGEITISIAVLFLNLPPENEDVRENGVGLVIARRQQGALLNDHSLSKG